MTTVNERPLADEAKAADAQADSASIAQAAPAAQTVRRQRISPLNRRRWENFKANRRGFWALWIFLALFGASLFAEFLVNDRPILVQYQGEYYYPTFVDYPEEVFGGFLPVTDYRDPFVQEEIAANGWAVWPPIRYSYRSVNNDIPSPAPSPPAWTMTKEERCQRYPLGAEDPNCTFGNMNWLGTDDQARDVLSRLVYGFRISVLFGLILTAASAVIGVAAGAVQGYFGGWVTSPSSASSRSGRRSRSSTSCSSSPRSCRRASGCCSASCCSSPGWPSSASCGPSSCARATSNT